jgi:hypothetical protein
VRGDDGGEGVVVFVGWGWEAGFDDRAGYGDRVVFLEVETAGDGRGYGWGEVVPGVCGVGSEVWFGVGSCWVLECRDWFG